MISACNKNGHGSDLCLKFNVNNPPLGFLLNNWKVVNDKDIKISTGSRTEFSVTEKQSLVNDIEINFFFSNQFSESKFNAEQEVALVAIMEITSELLAGLIDKQTCLRKFNELLTRDKLIDANNQRSLNFAHFKLFELLKSNFSDDDLKLHDFVLKLVKLVSNSSPYDEICSKLSSLKNPTKVHTKDEAKLEELVNAKQGQVVVRFPPEASGYLHIGHAKAAFINFFYKEKYSGKLLFRFDDTNPEKENSAFEEAILEDFKIIGLTYDSFSHTSDHFDTIIEHCTKLIREGKAFADNSSDTVMKEERESKLPSKFRDRSIDETMNIWNGMIKGDSQYKEYCIRAKIDYKHVNGSLRDPVIFRHKIAEHPHTGLKYKVYPTYIFACSIVDSIEGVTHVMRTTEYHDKDPVTYWFLDALKLRKYEIVGYGRLGLMNTILSKRKLTWFVNEKLVSGWDDPRMPTVRGMLRRGLTKQALRNYIESQGASKNTSMVSSDKLWAFNRAILQSSAPRFMAIKSESMLVANISGIEKDETVDIAINPTDPSQGMRKLSVGPKMFVDCPVKFDELKINSKINLISWMNFNLKSIDIATRTIHLEALPNDTDFKNILKMNHVNSTACVDLIEHVYQDLLTKPVITKDDDFKEFVNHNSMSTSKLIGEVAIGKLEKSTHFQIYRQGFYIVDKKIASDSNAVMLNKIPE